MSSAEARESRRAPFRLAAIGLACLVLALATYGVLRFTFGERPAIIDIRWAPSVPPELQHRLEQRYHLETGRDARGRTLTYDLTDLSTGNIRAFVNDPAVEDTHYIHRTAFRIWRFAPRGPYRGNGALLGPLVEATILLLLLAGFTAMAFALIEPFCPDALRRSVRGCSRGLSSMMHGDRASRNRAVLAWMVAVVIFVLTWIFRFNDLNASFAGLTDDHFFYLVRGWQILYGDLPVRDFVDHGAPLYFYVAAAVQVLFGRGTLSEVVFSVTALATGSALTFWLASRASGSILAGLLGTVFQILLAPRLYNYPKVLVYTAAIPLLWWFADRPRAHPRAWIALMTAIAFLFRHDHGLYVAIAMALVIVTLADVSWRERLRHAVLYSVLVVAVLAPYLLFIQWHGGIVSYFRQASTWAERDRGRAPVIWPGLFDNSEAVADNASPGIGGMSRAIQDNQVAWTYYLELLLPVFALCVVAISRDGFRPAWPHARAKLTMVAVLALVLDAGFLRSPLAARLADPSVPLAILVAWLAKALPALLRLRGSLRPWAERHVWLVRSPALLVGALFSFVLATGMTNNLYDRLDSAQMTEGPRRAIARIGTVSTQIRTDWVLQSWATRSDRPDVINLSLYVNACTQPTDRILVQAYIPQVLALARRAFAGGHADLRPGFFTTEPEQQLTLERLKSQAVPIILLDTDQSYQNFRRSFPLVTAYIDEEYELKGTHVFDGRFGISLFTRRSIMPTSVWAPLGWPCYGSGRIASS